MISMRWRTPTWADDRHFDEFWASHLAASSGKVLYVMGHGFDPRMNAAAKRILQSVAGRDFKFLLLSIEVEDVISDPDLNRLNAENYRELVALIGKEAIQSLKEPMLSEDGKASGPKQMARKIAQSMLEGYSDIILDISTLPRLAFITLIAYLLELVDSQEALGDVNLHVVVADNSEIDQSILGTGTDIVARPVVPFSTDIVAENLLKIPRIWVPLLSENQVHYLKSIKDVVRPNEVCPLLPFPSRNPRRADNIILSNPGLFEMLKIEPGNLVYAAESNPFDVYTQLMLLSQNYNDALYELGGANMVFSPLSNKIQTIGATLAAYELRRLKKHVSVIQMLPTSYVYQPKPGPTPVSKCHSLWLTGKEVVE